LYFGFVKDDSNGCRVCWDQTKCDSTPLYLLFTKDQATAKSVYDATACSVPLTHWRRGMGEAPSQNRSSASTWLLIVQQERGPRNMPTVWSGDVGALNVSMMSLVMSGSHDKAGRNDSPERVTKRRVSHMNGPVRRLEATFPIVWRLTCRTITIFAGFGEARGWLGFFTFCPL
jgi:hypothetical protein